MLNFVVAPRSELGRFRKLRSSNYQLMMTPVDYGRTHSTQKLVALPNVRERTALYNLGCEHFLEQIAWGSGIYGNVVVIDYRREKTIYSGNRFLISALFPQCNIFIHLPRSRQLRSPCVSRC